MDNRHHGRGTLLGGHIGGRLVEAGKKNKSERRRRSELARQDAAHGVRRGHEASRETPQKEAGVLVERRDRGNMEKGQLHEKT